MSNLRLRFIFNECLFSRGVVCLSALTTQSLGCEAITRASLLAYWKLPKLPAGSLGDVKEGYLKPGNKDKG